MRLIRAALDGMADSRYNFSLTTFDKSGRLGQIDHALKAVEHGSTALGICGEPLRVRGRRTAAASPAPHMSRSEQRSRACHKEDPAHDPRR